MRGIVANGPTPSRLRTQHSAPARTELPHEAVAVCHAFDARHVCPASFAAEKCLPIMVVGRQSHTTSILIPGESMVIEEVFVANFGDFSTLRCGAQLRDQVDFGHSIFL